MVVVWRNSCAPQLYAASPLSASGSGRDLGHTCTSWEVVRRAGRPQPASRGASHVRERAAYGHLVVRRVAPVRPVRQDEVAAQSGPRRTSAGQSRFVLPDTRQSPPRRPGVVQWDLVVARGSPARSGRGPGSGTTTSHWTARPTSHFPLDYPGWRRARKRRRGCPRTCSDPQACCPSGEGPRGMTPGACGSGGCSGFAGSCRRTGAA